MDPNIGPVNDDQPQSGYWRWLIVALVVCGFAGVTAWALVLTHAAAANQASTLDVRLITPAPQMAGGLSQDKAIEGEPGYGARVAGVRQFYANTFHLRPAGSDVAIYLGQLGTAAVNNSDLIIYLGFNLPEHDNTADTIHGALKGLGAELINATDVEVGGGPGDTSYDCVIGSGSAGIGTSGQLTACGWATDHTLAVFLRVAPDPQAKALISVMKKMRPDLIRGLSVS